MDTGSKFTKIECLYPFSDFINITYTTLRNGKVFVEVWKLICSIVNQPSNLIN